MRVHTARQSSADHTDCQPAGCQSRGLDEAILRSASTEPTAERTPLSPNRVGIPCGQQEKRCVTAGFIQVNQVQQRSNQQHDPETAYHWPSPHLRRLGMGTDQSNDNIGLPYAFQNCSPTRSPQAGDRLESNSDFRAVMGSRFFLYWQAGSPCRTARLRCRISHQRKVLAVCGQPCQNRIARVSAVKLAS